MNPATCFNYQLMDNTFAPEHPAGSWLCIDKALEVEDGDTVLAAIDGEMWLGERKWDEDKNSYWLLRPDGQRIWPALEFRVVGVVRWEVNCQSSGDAK
jgi:SOS-response transcriptional repressor LexA